jgi:hypothetical protein
VPFEPKSHAAGGASQKKDDSMHRLFTIAAMIAMASVAYSQQTSAQGNPASQVFPW